MIISAPHRFGVGETIIHHVEWADTIAGTKGMLCVWDLTDNLATPGILEETRGLRVKAHDGTGTTSGFDSVLSAGVLLSDVPITVAGTRGRMVLIQSFGAVDLLYGGNSVAAGDAILTPSNSPGFPGSSSSSTKAGVLSVVNLATYLPAGIGFNLENSGATFTVKKAFVKMLGIY